MRIVLKVSGEALKKDLNVSLEGLNNVIKIINEIKDNNELLIIVGGGNFWRGRNDLDINHDTSDWVGMLATVMNALCMNSYLNNKGILSSIQGSFSIPNIIENKDKDLVEEDLKNGKIVIFGGGSGRPGVSTDMTTTEIAKEYNADLILMSKNVDAIYDKDPKEEGANRIKEISHQELLDMSLKQDGLLVMDKVALISLNETKIPVYLYNANKISNLSEVFNGVKGTKVITK